MKIILDERENDLFCKISTLDKSQDIIIDKTVLNLGDIIIKNKNEDILFIIERKSFSDLLASIKDGRYDEQSYRLIHSSGVKLHRIIYLIEGMFSGKISKREKQLIYSAMTSLNVFKGFSVFRTCSLGETAEWLIHFVEKLIREEKKKNICSIAAIEIVHNNNDNKTSNESSIENTEIIHNDKITEVKSDIEDIPSYASVGGIKQKKNENITTQNIGEILLCQIPTINHITAVAIMREFSTFSQFMQTINSDPKCLDNIQVGNKIKMRKISKACVKNIQKYLIPTSFNESI